MTGIAIAGAGECGIRAAFALRELGYAGSVTVVGAEDVLPYERPPLSKSWTYTPLCDEERLAAAGIDLVNGIPATALDPAGHRVELADGRSLAYDRLLLATGDLALAPVRTSGLTVVGEVADRFRQARRVLNHVADRYLIGAGTSWFAAPGP